MIQQLVHYPQSVVYFTVQLHTLGQSLSQNIAVSGRDALLRAYHMLVVARGLIVLLLLMFMFSIS